MMLIIGIVMSVVAYMCVGMVGGVVWVNTFGCEHQKAFIRNGLKGWDEGECIRAHMYSHGHPLWSYMFGFVCWPALLTLFLFYAGLYDGLAPGTKWLGIRIGHGLRDSVMKPLGGGSAHVMRMIERWDNRNSGKDEG